MRPMLKPALAKLWRDPNTVQLGVDADRAVVLHASNGVSLDLLDLLDGSRDEVALVAAAAAAGQDPRSVGDVLATLTKAGLVDDAADPAVPAQLVPDLLALSLLHPMPGRAAALLRLRHSQTVAVLGGGRVGSSIVGLLAAAGVGNVTVHDDDRLQPADLTPTGVRSMDRTGARRGPAAQALGRAVGRAIGRNIAAGHRAAASDGPVADFVVLAPTGPVIPPEWLDGCRVLPHLAVVIRETCAVIGPLVHPGRTPCLRCLELARSDRDSTWPSLAAQLLGAQRRTEPCDVTLAALTAALSSMLVLTALAGDTTGGEILDFDLADRRLRRRNVSPHPACGCGAADR